MKNLIVPLLLVAALTGCSSVRTITVSTLPEAAAIRVNGDNVGAAPKQVNLDFGSIPSYTISAHQTGYLSERISLHEKDPRVKQGFITIGLDVDEAYQATTTSEAVNNWLRVQVNDSIDKDAAWQRLIDSITSCYDSLEQMDKTAGYVRSMGKVRKFDRGENGPFRIRTSFLGSISSDEPLIYKFKIRSESRLEHQSDQDWKPYDRVFLEDAQLVEELQNRLGIR